MPELIPPRPQYAKERMRFGYPVLPAFLSLFLLRLLARHLPTAFSSPWLMLLLQFGVFLLPTLLFIRARGRGYSRTLRLHRPYVAHIPLLLSAFFALFSGALLLSILCGGIRSLGNSATAYESVVPSSIWAALAILPVLAVLPAILEELMFRGILFAELDRRGALRAILVSALLFALIHFDLANLPVYFYAGVLLALVLYATDSLPATMLLHATYNLCSLLGQRYVNAFYHFTGSVELFLFFLILVLLISLLFFCRECAKLYRQRVEAEVRPPRRDIPRDVQLYTMLDVLGCWPVILCLAISILGFILL